MFTQYISVVVSLLLSIDKTVFLFLIMVQQYLCSSDQVRQVYNGLCPVAALASPTGWSGLLQLQG